MFPSRGPRQAKIAVIGDAPYGSDTQIRLPFSGSATQIVPLLLNRNGCIWNTCFSCYVVPEPLHHFREESDYLVESKKAGTEHGWTFVDGYFVRPWLLGRRSELLASLDSIGVDCVLLTGELALWTVTGQKSISTVRGSIYPSLPLPSGRTLKCVCTYAPRQINTNPALKDIFERDIERFVFESKFPEIREPKWDFLLQASASEYLSEYAKLLIRLDAGEKIFLTLDIETIRQEVACIGIGLSRTRAIVLPLRTSREYWPIDVELTLLTQLARVLEHPNARVVLQNGGYDVTMLAVKHGTIARLYDDTMDMQHVLFPGLKKSLDFLASVYCDYYQYWKDELDDYRQAPRDDNKFFAYNGRDCCYTFEIREKLEGLLQHSGLYNLYRERMERSFWTILRTNLRGIRLNHSYRSKLALELLDAGTQRQQFLNYVIGRDFNPKSPKQMKEFFYDEMGVKPEKSRISKKDSLGAEILVKMHENYPLLGPIADAIIEMRSIGVFMSTFIQSACDQDGRMRTSFALTGAETFRLKSRETVWGTGGNMQNIPDGSRSKTGMKMPNIRSLYLPDPGYEIFDIDLAGADAQVVAWEADDARLKEMFRKRIKVHAENAKELFGGNAGPDGKKEPYYTRTKAGVHLTNYGGYPPTMAKALGITVKEAEAFQNRWFQICPGIKEWHKRVESDLHSKRIVTNRFGFRKKFFGRIDRALPEALAWGPQSTVAIVTNRAMDIIDLEWKLALIYLQVHDSIVFGLPIHRPSDYASLLLESLRITIPFDDPLIIPFGLNSSTISWGDCKG